MSKWIVIVVLALVLVLVTSGHVTAQPRCGHSGAPGVYLFEETFGFGSCERFVEPRCYNIRGFYGGEVGSLQMTPPFYWEVDFGESCGLALATFGSSDSGPVGRYDFMTVRRRSGGPLPWPGPHRYLPFVAMAR